MPPSDKGQSRRAFLGTAAAAGATTALMAGDYGTTPALQWCRRPTFPFAKKRCYLRRGRHPKGVEARLQLLIDGPAFDEPQVMDETTVVLEQASWAWALRLPFEHPDLVPGEYRYVVRARLGDETIESPPASYTIKPFGFGV